jgi:hypothetical protein
MLSPQSAIGRVPRFGTPHQRRLRGATLFGLYAFFSMSKDIFPAVNIPEAKVAYRRRLSELREELEGLGGVALVRNLASIRQHVHVCDA